MFLSIYFSVKLLCLFNQTFPSLCVSPSPFPTTWCTGLIKMNIQSISPTLSLLLSLSDCLFLSPFILSYLPSSPVSFSPPSLCISSYLFIPLFIPLSLLGLDFDSKCNLVLYYTKFATVKPVS